MVRLYIAAKYSRKQECRILAHALVARGVGTTSRWHDLEVNESEQDSVQLQGYAERDLADIRAADGLVMLNHDEESVGRHIELGYALGLGKPVMVVGNTESVFHHLKEVKLGSQFVDILGWARSIQRTEK